MFLRKVRDSNPNNRKGGDIYNIIRYRRGMIMWHIYSVINM